MGVSRDCPVFWVPCIISGTGKATNFKFCTHILSIDRNKSPLKISGKVAGCVVRTLKTFQGTHILGESCGLLCDSSAVLLLLPITSSHSHASASDSTFDYWRYINFSLTLTLKASSTPATSRRKRRQLYTLNPNPNLLKAEGPKWSLTLP